MRGAFVLILLLAGHAMAQPVEPAQAVTHSDWIGGQLDLFPSGSLELSANNMSSSGEGTAGIGLGAVVDLELSELISVGFAPRLVTGVKAKGAGDSSNQLDLRGRATIGRDVASNVRLHGIATLGYSITFGLLVDSNLKRYNTHGFIFGFGGGVAYQINPRLQLLTELSYELGFQGTTVMGADVGLHVNLMTLGVGLVTPL